MKITYINHSSFLAEAEHSVFLFDYYQGVLPAIPETKKLYVFASHHHGDHFSPDIFKLADTHPDIQFVLSTDIFPSNVPAPLHDKTVHLKAHAAWSDPYITVTTLNSTDEGVAFLIRCEDKTIYHAGDLNWWRWEGEPDYWNQQMEENFKKFIEPLRNMKIDIAFIPLDPRQEKDYCLGMDYYLALTDTKTIYPMHCWGDYTIIDRWLEEHPDSPDAGRIVKIHMAGEIFDLQ